jgi:hypothetical protein
VNDLQARRISATENLQLEDFSAIESIEAIVEIIDAHLIEDNEYAAMGQTPEIRLNVLFGKLHSIQNSLDRKSKVSEKVSCCCINLCNSWKKYSKTYLNVWDAGWKITQYIDCPMSSQRFHPGVVSQMQKKRTLGVVRRTLIIARKR